MYMAPDAISVSCMPNYVLRVKFETGETRDFDVREQLLPHKGYKRLENPTYFHKAHIDYGTVVWDEQIDIAPEWLYEKSRPVAM